MDQSIYASKYADPKPAPSVTASHPATASVDSVSDAFQATSMEDEFAQTVDTDDLFADDFEPVVPTQEPVPAAEEPVHQAPAPETASFSRAPPTAPRGPRGNRGRGDHSNRGRRGGLDSSRYATTPASSSETPSSTEKSPKPQTNTTQQSTASSSTLPVREKLSESKLTEIMAARALANAKREEKYRLAQADEEAFRARENQAVIKQKEEAASRQAMLDERKKNAARKMKAMGNREWDERKEEVGVEAGRAGKGRGSGFRRGAFGGVAREDLQGSRFGDAREDDRPEGERGGYRGGRGGRGRGGNRGEHQQGAPRNGAAASQPQVVPQASDFPELPQGPKKPAVATVPATKDEKANGGAEKKEDPVAALSPSLLTPKGEKQSWADQVENAL